MTLFLGRGFRSEDPLLLKFADEVAQASKESDLEVWTRRLALPPASAEEFFKLAGLLNGHAGELFDFAAIPTRVNGLDDVKVIVNALDKTKNIFTSVYGGKTELKLFAELVREAFLKLGPEVCSRISFTMRKPLLTPYFPAASAPPNGSGIAASMLYVNDLRKALSTAEGLYGAIRKAHKRVNDFLHALLSSVGVQNYGVDLSISPWMEESVARLIEALSEGNFGSPGSYSAVHELNEAIGLAASASGIKAIGFNEVMLPYAEDSRLRELGAKGELTAYSLLSFASICVAGLDMVVLPYRSGGELLRFLEDVYAVLFRKPTPAGIRVVPVEAEAGDRVKLGRFGSVPVMKLK